VTRLIDVPCGDLSWLDLCLLRDRNVSYVGMDVSHRVINRNIRAFGAGAGNGTGTGEGNGAGSGAEAGSAAGEDTSTPAPTPTPPYPPTVRFLQGDVVAPGALGLGGLGLGPSDLILCRHLMLHLPPADNLAVLHTLANSGARWALLTTFLRADENQIEFVFGQGHHVNLLRAPYCLPDPLRLYGDYTRDMYLGLWDLQMVREVRDRPRPEHCMV
jgi:hypothetical protein